jgi:hypothetical protein
MVGSRSPRSFWIIPCLVLVFVAGCSGNKPVQVEQKSSSLDRQALKQSRLALLPVVAADGIDRPELEREVLATLGAWVDGGNVMDPIGVRSSVGARAQALSDLTEGFRTRATFDPGALADVGDALVRDARVDYLVVVRLSEVSGYADPGRPDWSARGTNAGATVRLGIVRASDGQTEFMGVTTVRKEPGSYTSDPAPPPVSSGQITRSTETTRYHAGEASPAGAVREAVRNLLAKI